MTDIQMGDVSGECKLGKVEKKAAFDKWQATRKEYTADLVCTCRSFDAPHHLNAHRHLTSDHDWRTWDERNAKL